PRADAGDDPGRAIADLLEEALARQHAEPIGLVEIGGDLRDQAVRTEPDRAGEAGSLEDLAFELPGARLRRRAIAEVDVGLIEAEHLDDVAEAADDVHDLGRGGL